jgi:hypothetical protein
MAEHKEAQSGQATKGIGGTDPRQHNKTSTGRGESGSARDENARGVAHGSSGSGRMSNESDRDEPGESGAHRPSHRAEPDDMPLTLGSNGGGPKGDQPSGSETGRGPRGTEVRSEGRKAS